MATSIWVGYPRSYTAGRLRPPQFVTLHYTAGSEGPTSAENGVAYDKIRTDGTSTHYFTDSSGLALQEVPDGDRAHAALYHGNQIGIHIEICGTAQSRAQWLDPISLATLKTTAALTRELCQRHGFPMVRLTTAQTRAAWYAADGSRPRGINDHNAITLAFPEDGGTHTDVGPEFPWDVFMGLVTASEEEEMVSHLWRDTTGQHWYVTGPLQFKRRVSPSEVDSIRYYAGGPGGLAGFTLVDLVGSVGTDPTVIPGVDVTDIAGSAAGGGATPAEVREIVDSELDEAFRGAADTNG
jgi:N-acetyl-anhydromuramyl-L-alanine amidase AmpD